MPHPFRHTPHGIALLLAVLVLVATLVMPAAVVAQSGERPYDGLDLVILVDQSGSMGGLNYGSSDHPAVNDSNALRFEAAKFIMDWLGRASLTYGLDLEKDFRVALLDFGDTVESRLDPPIVTIDPGSDQEWEPTLRKLQQDVSAESFGRRNLGNTNHLLAFQRARQIFDDMDAEGLSGNRLRAIIMLTDGIPYVLQTPDATQSATPASDGSTPTPAPPSPIPLDRYMTDLISFVRENFPSPEYRIFVVGMNDSDQEQWGPVVRYWNQVTNSSAELVKQNEQAGATLQKYLEELRRIIGMGRGGFPAECGPYVVPPYLQLIRFNVHKATAQDRIGLRVNNADLDLQDPSKATVRGADSVIETIEIPNPEPGFWDIVCPPSAKLDPEIYSEEVQMVAQLLGPTGRQLQYVPAPIQLKLSGYGGSALPRYADPKYRLDVEARLTQPSGETVIPLTLNDQGVYTAPFTPVEPGVHRIAITATTQDPKGNPIELLNEDKGEFTVSITRPRLVEAPATTVLVPSQVRIEITDDQSRRVAPEVFTTLGSQLYLALDEPQGRQTFSLQAQQDGSLLASVVPLEPGDHSIALTTDQSGSGVGSGALDQPLGTLAVAPLAVQLVGLDDPQPQYGTVKVQLHLLDRDGKPVTGANPAPALAGDITLTGAVESSHALQSEGDGLWTATVRPEKSGNVNVGARFSTTGDSPRTIFDAQVGTFEVTATTLLSLAVISPKNGDRLAYNGILPFLKNPLDVRVELRGDGQPIDPALALADPARPPFTLAISDSQGQDRSSEVTIEPAGESGRWRAFGDELTGRDTYLINVIGNAPLKPAYIWDEQPQSLSVVRIPNRLLPLTYGVFALIVLGVLFAGWSYANNHFVKQKATGVLTIIDSNERTIGAPCNLDGRGVHTLKWSPNASLAGVKSVRVTGTKNGVKVKVTKTKGAPLVRDLTNGARAPLNPGFFLTYTDRRGGGAPSSINW